MICRSIKIGLITATLVLRSYQSMAIDVVQKSDTFENILSSGLEIGALSSDSGETSLAALSILYIKPISQNLALDFSLAQAFGSGSVAVIMTRIDFGLNISLFKSGVYKSDYEFEGIRFGEARYSPSRKFYFGAGASAGLFKAQDDSDASTGFYSGITYIEPVYKGVSIFIQSKFIYFAGNSNNLSYLSGVIGASINIDQLL
jgi:hypothetical protein